MGRNGPPPGEREEESWLEVTISILLTLVFVTAFIAGLVELLSK
jgi:hypothetical protein